jgi:hypothetical protein
VIHLRPLLQKEDHRGFPCSYFLYDMLDYS